MVINSTNINKANDNLSPQAIKHKKNTPHGVGNPDPVLGQPVDVGVQAQQVVPREGLDSNINRLSQDRTWTLTSTGCPKTGPGLQHQQVVPRQDLDFQRHVACFFYA
jgi:hypothetical protein